MCRACLQIHRQVPVRPLGPPGRCPPTKLESLSWCDARVYVVPERFAVEPRTNFQARIARSSADRVRYLGTLTFADPSPLVSLRAGRSRPRSSSWCPPGHELLYLGRGCTLRDVYTQRSMQWFCEMYLILGLG